MREANCTDEQTLGRMESTGVPATTVKSARKRLEALVRAVNVDTVAVEIVGKRDNAVLISKARYTALQEATFLLRSPELMESLRREMARSLVAAEPEQPEQPTEDAGRSAAKRPQRSRTRARKKRKKRKKSQ